MLSAAPAPAPAEAPATPAAARDPVSLWPSVLAAMGPLQRAGLADARPLSFEKGVLTLGFPLASESFDFCNSHENARLLATKFEQLGAGRVRVQFIRSEGFSSAASLTSSPASVPVAKEGATPTSVVAPSNSAAGARTPGSPIAESKSPKAAPVKLDKAEFLNDPLIQQALEIFKAQIVEVHAANDAG